MREVANTSSPSSSASSAGYDVWRQCVAAALAPADDVADLETHQGAQGQRLVHAARVEQRRVGEGQGVTVKPVILLSMMVSSRAHPLSLAARCRA